MMKVKTVFRLDGAHRIEMWWLASSCSATLKIIAAMSSRPCLEEQAVWLVWTPGASGNRHTYATPFCLPTIVRRHTVFHIIYFLYPVTLDLTYRETYVPSR